MTRLIQWRLLAIGAVIAASAAAAAGPPFVTDDPEPVELGHWEVYVASQLLRTSVGDTGTLPHLEINNGAAPNLQLHVVVPYAFDSPAGGKTTHGIGDTELGVKFRFVLEDKCRPMVGIFPLLELPTGDSSRALGAGTYRAFLPVWAQKSWGSWTSYGGGGYWINPGVGNCDFWLLGLVVQRDLGKSLTLGGELLWASSSGVRAPADTAFNVGGQYNFDDGHHLLFSMGRSIGGDATLTGYVAIQWTFRGKAGR